jgi:hypothetical protein
MRGQHYLKQNLRTSLEAERPYMRKRQVKSSQGFHSPREYTLR